MGWFIIGGLFGIVAMFSEKSEIKEIKEIKENWRVLEKERLKKSIEGKNERKQENRL